MCNMLKNYGVLEKPEAEELFKQGVPVFLLSVGSSIVWKAESLKEIADNKGTYLKKIA